ncbi:MAG: P-loop NTPase fold protein [Pseudomonadota bacterium]
MMHPDNGFTKLAEIYTSFGNFCQHKGQITESDTRAKIIDRILKEVLDWPEDAFNRELPVHQGFLDYLLMSGSRNLIVVEAKREGIPFEIPQSLMTRKKYKISGSIKTNPLIKEAIEQVQRYCIDLPVRYASVTNGYAWLVFRAIREDISWLNGQVIVFPSAGYIKDHFVEFWNLLSFQAVLDGSLEKAFSSEITTPRLLTRPIDQLRNPDAPLFRNRFHMHLHPFVEGVFRDIGEKEIEILEKCYVYNRSLKIIDEDLQLIIKDSIPNFVSEAVETKPGHRDSGPLGEEIKKAVVEGRGGIIFLLLGGIGSGKSTFIKRFSRYIGKPFIDKTALWFDINFIAPPDQDQIDLFIMNSILQQLRTRYDSLRLESRESLCIAYEDRIKLLREAFTENNGKPSNAFIQRLNANLEKWMRNITEYTPRIVRQSRNHGKTNIICIDNVDQLSPDYQSKIFLLSQRIAKEMQAVVIVALREESYYAASIQKAFTAYNNRTFHIASPPFKELISLRLKFCREMLQLPPEQVLFRLGTSIEFDRAEISKFLDIIKYSIFSINKNIARFIEALAFGNMREALDMFATFLYSGTTNVDKMLKIYDRDGQYFVAFHEFAKSVILGDRRFYRDSASKVLNLFDCGTERNSSHFTSIRLLSLLLGHVNESSPEGRGFVNIEQVFSSFLDIFDNEHDLTRSIIHILRKQLIQLDTRSTDSIKDARYVRISSAGWYYYKFLLRSFAYLDLVFQDTPLNDPSVAAKLKNLIIEVDDIAETQEFMTERMELRYARVEIFLNYLIKEEQREYEMFSLNTTSGILNQRFMHDIQKQYMTERGWIEKRVKNKAERQPDDTLVLDNKIPALPDQEENAILDSE